jgi:hypothetical protein
MTEPDSRTGRFRSPLTWIASGSLTVRSATLPAPFPTLVQVLRSAASSTWVVAAVVAWLSLPAVDLHPEAGLDPSWGIGLSLAYLHGLDFGRDIIFTYGPLGFLVYPRLLTPWLGLTGLFYIGAVQFALCATLLSCARRIVPLLGAAVLVYLTARTLLLPPTTMYLPLVAFIWCAGVLRAPESSPPHLNRTLAILGGAVAALELLVAFYVGVFFLVSVGATVAVHGRNRLRNLGLFLLAFVVTEATLWLALRQSVGSFLPFIRRSMSIASGYSTAMGIEEAGRKWEYVAALVLVIVLLSLAVVSTRGLRQIARIELLALTGFFSWFQFKHGFIRHDGHSMAFFSAMAGAPLAFAVRPADRWRVVLAGAVAFVAFFAASQANLSLLDPLPQARASLNELRTVLGPRRWAVIADDRSRLRATYGVDESTVSLLRGKTVHIWPYDAGVAWAYPEMTWRPLPVFQTYSAYTDLLDDADASFLRSARAPERILRNLPVVIDGRFGSLEAPASTLAMLCRYHELHVTPSWQVLGRVRNRCGKPQLISVVHTVSYGPVRVPAPHRGEVVVARIHGLGPSFWERIGAMAYKLAQRTILLNRDPFRLVPETADHPLIMNIGSPGDYSGPFALSPGASEVAVIRGALGAPSKSPIDIAFYRIPIRGTGAVAGDAAAEGG